MITGAARGIGRCLVLEFLKEGARVVGLDRDEKALGDLRTEAGRRGFAIDTRVADVGERKGFLDVLGECRSTFGAPWVFVNNAGIAKAGGFLGVGIESTEAMVRVNLLGVLTGTHFALDAMTRAGGGVIVNMASTAGHVPGAFLAAYSAAKHGVVGLTRALQTELRISGSPVKLVLVSPGFINTALMRDAGVSLSLSFQRLVASPENTALAVVAAVKSGRSELIGDFGGWLIQTANSVAPRLTARVSRLLVARTWRQALGLDPIKF